MPSHPFSYEVRALLCPGCRNACAGPDGGVGQCPACGAAVEFRARAAFLPRGAEPWPGRQDPALAAQTGLLDHSFGNLAHLWEDGAIPAHRREEAWLAWVGLRRRAAEDLEAGDSLMLLTRELAGQLEEQGALFEARATIESALEACPVARQKADLLGQLVRMAVRAGQREEATRWLAHFADTSTIEADSCWRLSAAVVASAAGEHQRVLEVLGAELGAVALWPAAALAAAAWRIHALCCLDRRDEAQRQLEALLAAGPEVRPALERIQVHLPTPTLLGDLMAPIVERRAARAIKRAGRWRIVMGWVLVVPQLVAAGIVAAVSDTPLTALFVLLCGAPFLIWGIRSIRAGRRERRIAERGVSARATVLEAKPTGTSVNDVPELAITVEVALRPPVQAVLKRLVHAGELHAFTPGAVLQVKVDPQEPGVALLDE